MRTFYCSKCKQVKPAQESGGTGYATMRNNHKVCYSCCAAGDRADMIKHGRIDLYLVEDRPQEEVINWPGTLRFPVLWSKAGQHNIARTRTDVWFTGPDGFLWRGTQYGEWSQVCHCRRTKNKVK